VHDSGLLRRLGAVLYDSLLVLALWFVATIPFVAARHGEAVDPGNLAYQLTLLAVAYAFFVGFWCRTGSTLGMLAWGLRVEMPDRRKPTLGRASIRFFAAMLSWAAAALGFLWQLWDRDGLAWHDRLSGTRLRHYPKK
jgi:uncharacterized RDD family membrane protein YckC